MQNSGSLCFYLEWVLKCLVTEVVSFYVSPVEDRFSRLCVINCRNDLLTSGVDVNSEVAERSRKISKLPVLMISRKFLVSSSAKY